MPISADLSDASRLTGQNAKLLALLRKGPATNADMITVIHAYKYTSRISDVRRWLKYHTGEQIDKQHLGGGVWEYRIVPML